MAIVFDTYSWIEYFNGTDKGSIARRYLQEDKILTPSIVLLELSYKSDKEGWDFKKYFNFIRLNSEIIGINEKFILSFGREYNKIKKKVKKIGITDIIIIHTANLYGAKILTGDEHFKKINRAIIL